MTTKLTRIKFNQQQAMTRHEYLLTLIDITNKGFMIEEQLIRFAGFLGLKEMTVKSYLRELEREKIVERIFIDTIQMSLVVLKKPAVAFVREIDYKSCPATFKDNQTSNIQVIRNMMKVEAILTLKPTVWEEPFRKSEEKDLAKFIKAQLDLYASTLHLRKDELYMTYYRTTKKEYFDATRVQVARSKENIKNAKISDREKELLTAYYEEIKTNTYTMFTPFVHALVNAKADTASTQYSKDDLYTLWGLERFDVYVQYADKGQISYIVLDVHNSLTVEKLDSLYIKLAKHSKLAGYKKFEIIWYTQSQKRVEYLKAELMGRMNRKIAVVFSKSGMIRQDEEKDCPFYGADYRYMSLDAYVSPPPELKKTTKKDVEPISSTPSELSHRVTLGEEF